MSDYYVIQVGTKKEKEVIDFINNSISSAFFDSCFYVTKEHKKKYEGKWHLIEEKCFPGYIFVETSCPKEFCVELKRIHQFVRFLGMDRENDFFLPITDTEKIFIDSLLNKTDEDGKKIVPLSGVEILDDKTIKILTGPLVGYEGKIVKLDLHKRKVIIDVYINGRPVRTELGINILNKDE